MYVNYSSFYYAIITIIRIRSSFIILTYFSFNWHIFFSFCILPILFSKLFISHCIILNSEECSHIITCLVIESNGHELLTRLRIYFEARFAFLTDRNHRDVFVYFWKYPIFILRYIKKMEWITRTGRAALIFT